MLMPIAQAFRSNSKDKLSPVKLAVPALFLVVPGINLGVRAFSEDVPASSVRISRFLLRLSGVLAVLAPGKFFRIYF